MDFLNKSKVVFENYNNYCLAPSVAMIKLSGDKRKSGSERFLWTAAGSLTSAVSLPFIAIEVIVRIALGTLAKTCYKSDRAKAFSKRCLMYIGEQIGLIPVVLVFGAIPIYSIYKNCKGTKPRPTLQA